MIATWLKILAWLAGLVAVVAIFAWQQARIDRFAAETAMLRAQVERQAALLEESKVRERPQPGEEIRSNSVSALPQEQFRELLRLRGEVGVLRRQLAEMSEQASRDRSQPQLRPGRPTDGQGRTLPPANLSPDWMDADPAAAFASSAQLNPAERRKFLDAGFAAWARKDTEAALRWVEQNLSDPAEKEAATKAIRSVAPVGIGAELSMQNGYAVINRLLPGTAAEFSGQLRPGDRILAVAQGDNVFTDARTLNLHDLVQNIRGAPGSLIQLQVAPADAPPDSPPRTVILQRSQIKFKR